MGNSFDGLYYEFADSAATDTLHPIVFVHGFPFSSAMWTSQVTAVQGLGLATLVYDLRGLGRSAVGDGQYTVESHVDDLFGLLDHLGLKAANVVGLSMGGYIVLRAIEREPGRFKSAILCDTKSEGDPSEVRIKRAENVKVVKEQGAAAFANGFVPGVFAPRSLEDQKEAVERIRSVISGQTPLGIAGNLLALASRPDTTASLSNIKIPVLLLCGEHDKTTPLSVMEAMHRQIPGAAIHVIPDAAHMSNLENEKVFNARLVEFVQTNCR